MTVITLWRHRFLQMTNGDVESWIIGGLGGCREHHQAGNENNHACSQGRAQTGTWSHDNHDSQCTGDRMVRGAEEDLLISDA